MVRRKTSSVALIFAGFLVVAVLTVFLGVGAFVEINALADLNARLYRHPLAVSNAALETKAAIAAIQRDLRNVALARSDRERDASIAAIREFEWKIDRNLDITAERFLGDKSQIDALRRSLDEWKPIREQIVALAAAGQLEETIDLARGRSSAHVNFLFSQLDRVIDSTRTTALDFQSLSETQNRHSRMILGGLGTAIFLAIALVTVFVILKVRTAERLLLENEAMLRRSQKMEAVGQLTGGIAHDFNNILAIVMGFLGILQRAVAGNPTALECVEKALKGAERGAQLTRKLLKFSRKEPGPATLTAVNEIIRDMRDLIAKSMTAGITVETHLADDAWPTMIDPGDLEDAILNLTLNAYDAMPDGGILVIETANKVLDEHYVRRNLRCRTGDYVMVSVSDTGTGMTREVRERIFEPFFTTKGTGGTGLGLSMVFGFVRRSNGHIKVYSEPGHGTTIRIYLPRAREDAVSRRNEPAGKPLRGNETILVVDDEESLVDIARTYMEELGYRTIAAGNSEQALEILRNDMEINLLFSDVVMPGPMDGYRLALAARDVRPDIKILLSSGFTPKREEFANGAGAFCAELAANLLSKPYNQAELALALRRRLDADAAVTTPGASP